MEKTVTLSKEEYDNLIEELTRLKDIENENSILTVTKSCVAYWRHRNEVKVYKGDRAINEMQKLLNFRIKELDELSVMNIFKFIKWKNNYDIAKDC